ncbi:MAG: iron-sulfur cluster assembly scaffold protein [Pseudomonadota bacterium]
MPESGSKLYTPRLLGLAASLYEIPFDSAALYKGQARSKTCGSSIDISLSLNADGTISKVGMAVKACAIGQASAAILAGGARGRSGKELLAVFREIEAWLQSTGSLPDWPEFDALEPALPHAGRHGALLIPWRAINDALSSPARPS